MDGARVVFGESRGAFSNFLEKPCKDLALRDTWLDMAVSASLRQARFEDIYRAEAGAVLGYVSGRAGRDHAEDLVAETFAVAWRKLEDVPLDRPRPWLFAVARKTMANHFRAGRRGQQVELSERDLADTSDLADALSARAEVVRALLVLHPKDREAVVLIAWHDLTYAEAADVMGCTSATFAVRLHRARARLRRILTDAETTLRPFTPTEASS